MLDGPRVHPALRHEVDREVLHGRIEQLLHDAGQPVDLVDEQHVVLVEVRQDAEQIAATLDGRARRRDQRRGHLVGDHAGQRRLAEPRRPREENVVERLVAPLGGVERDAEVLLDALLADEVVEPARPQRALDLLVRGVQHRGGEALAHTNSLAPAPESDATPCVRAGPVPPSACHTLRGTQRQPLLQGSSQRTTRIQL